MKRKERQSSRLFDRDSKVILITKEDIYDYEEINDKWFEEKELREEEKQREEERIRIMKERMEIDDRIKSETEENYFYLNDFYLCQIKIEQEEKEENENLYKEKELDLLRNKQFYNNDDCGRSDDYDDHYYCGRNDDDYDDYEYYETYDDEYEIMRKQMLKKLVEFCRMVNNAVLSYRRGGDVTICLQPIIDENFCFEEYLDIHSRYLDNFYSEYTDDRSHLNNFENYLNKINFIEQDVNQNKKLMIHLMSFLGEICQALKITDKEYCKLFSDNFNLNELVQKEYEKRENKILIEEQKELEQYSDIITKINNNSNSPKNYETIKSILDEVLYEPLFLEDEYDLYGKYFVDDCSVY